MTLTKEEIHQIQFELRNYSHDVPFCDGYRLAATKYLLQLKAERERAGKLMEALEGIIQSWDSRGGGHEIEQKKVMFIEGYSQEYWSPVASLVDSEKISAARTAINEYNNKP